MEEMVAFIKSFNTGNWIAIAALIVALFGVSFTGANYLAGRRERKLKSFEGTPKVKATINGKLYRDGWRSVQLHIGPAEEQPNFQYGNWRIERAQLLQPRSATLARAENDDYATGVFYPDNPIRVLEGKGVDRPQRFALEFFIKFDGADDRGQKAKFKVIYSHLNKRRRHIVRIWAAVPDDAE